MKEEVTTEASVLAWLTVRLAALKEDTACP